MWNRGMRRRAHLRDVLARIADHPIRRSDKILPWHWTAANNLAVKAQYQPALILTHRDRVSSPLGRASGDRGASGTA